MNRETIFWIALPAWLSFVAIAGYYSILWFLKAHFG